MIISVSILAGITIGVAESAQEELIEFLTESCMHQYNKFTIYISSATNTDCRAELDSMFGSDLDGNLAILPDSDFPFGTVKIKVTDTRTGEDTWKIGEVFKRKAKYDLGRLKEEISMNSPSFLITNNATWIGIASLDYENVDKFDNSPAYYHSYCKVPIAISEFVEPNEVMLVE